MNNLTSAFVLLATLSLTAGARSQQTPDMELPEEVLSWGADNYGQSTVPAVPAPTASASNKFKRVSAGRWHSAAVTNDGQLLAWGRNDAGQCNVPSANGKFVNVSAGGWHTVALMDDGSAVAWGRNTDGQCNVPALPSGMKYVEVVAGGYHSVGRRSDGSVVAWGQNHVGQCNVPSLPNNTYFAEIDAGMLHTVARLTSSKIKAWGSNQFGQCNVPEPVSGVYTTQVAAGAFHSMVRRSDGSIEAWGSNSNGQTDVPALPAGLQYTVMDGGEAHSVALLSDGSVAAWGRNVEGQCDVPSGVQFVWAYTGDNLTAGGNHTMGRTNMAMANLESFGVGCPASQPLTLSSSMPSLNSTWELFASNVESSSTFSAAVFVFGTSAISSGVGLSANAAEGCSGYTTADIQYVIGMPLTTSAAGIYACPCPIPNNPALVGFAITVQASAPSSSTSIGFATSNGLTAVVGY